MSNHNKFKLFYTDSIFCHKCKTIGEKLQLYTEHHINKHFFDPYSLYHIIFGIILGLLLNNLGYVIIVAFLFEICENSFFGVFYWKNIGLSKLNEFYYDDVLNIIGDIISAIIGFYISRLGTIRSIIIIILFLFIYISYVIINPSSIFATQHMRTINRFL